MQSNPSLSTETNISDNNKTDTFPSNEATKLQDISTLLEGAPVIESGQGTDNGRSNQSALAGNSSIASAEDFAEEDVKPFARRVAPRTVLSAGLAALLLLPLSALFIGGKSSQPNSNSQAANIENDEANTTISSEQYAAQQAELEAMRSQIAFTTQQVDAEAIDAAGRQRAAAANAERQPSTTADPRAKAPATTASSPAQPAPVRTTRTPPPPRTAAPTRVASTPSRTAPRFTQSSAPPRETVDPFERRAQLQALGSYGAPPPSYQGRANTRGATQATNPFGADSYYIQTISFDQPSTEATVSSATTNRDLTYQQDANAVLSGESAEEIPEQAAPEADRRTERSNSAVIGPRVLRSTESNAQAERAIRPSNGSPMAIMPGTSAEADLSSGFSWQEGSPFPDVILTTTEDIAAGGTVVIPVGAQFLTQAFVNPSSGLVRLEVIGLFGDYSNIQIPRSSIVVQAQDSSALIATTTEGSSAPGPNVSGFLLESIGNGLGNVIDGNDSLIGDIAGGVTETWIDHQVERSEANANARASRRSSQPTVWSLDARTVRLTFNNYVPLTNTRRL